MSAHPASARAIPPPVADSREDPPRRCSGDLVLDVRPRHERPVGDDVGRLLRAATRSASVTSVKVDVGWLASVAIKDDEFADNEHYGRRRRPFVLPVGDQLLELDGAQVRCRPMSPLSCAASRGRRVLASPAASRSAYDGAAACATCRVTCIASRSTSFAASRTCSPPPLVRMRFRALDSIDSVDSQLLPSRAAPRRLARSSRQRSFDRCPHGSTGTTFECRALTDRHVETPPHRPARRKAGSVRRSWRSFRRRCVDQPVTTHADHPLRRRRGRVADRALA